MKKSLLILVTAIGFAFTTNAQDVITLKNGDEIKSLVQEIGIDEVKYKKWDNQTGPIYIMKKSDIFMIKYQNGSKDVFNEEAKPVETKNAVNLIPEVETVKKKEKISTRKRYTFFHKKHVFGLDFGVGRDRKSVM